MALLLALVAAAGDAGASGAYELHNGTVAAGGAQLQDGRWRLVGTQGEPVMAVVASHGWVLAAGFPATLAAAAPAGSRAVFRDGFETVPDGEDIQ